MALLFFDGFDYYTTFLQRWDFASGSISVNATNGRRGTPSFRSTNWSAWIGKLLPVSRSTFIVGFSLKVANFATNGSTQDICSFYDSVGSQVALAITTTGAVCIRRGVGGTTIQTSSNTMSGGVEYYIEWKVTISDSIAADSCIVRVNGVDWLNVTAGSDLKNQTGSTADRIYFGQITSPPSGVTQDMDDIYVCDNTGATHNDFLGDCRVDCIFPNADGTYSQFTPSTGTSHYQLVDETAPNSTDYNESNTAGNRDSYGMQDLAAVTGTIYAVQTHVASLKGDAGYRGLKSLVKSGTTVQTGPTVSLATSLAYDNQMFTTDPNTGAAWTESAVNAMEVGGEVS